MNILFFINFIIITAIPCNKKNCDNHDDNEDCDKTKHCTSTQTITTTLIKPQFTTSIKITSSTQQITTTLIKPQFTTSTRSKITSTTFPVPTNSISRDHCKEIGRASCRERVCVPV